MEGPKDGKFVPNKEHESHDRQVGLDKNNPYLFCRSKPDRPSFEAVSCCVLPSARLLELFAIHDFLCKVKIAVGD